MKLIRKNVFETNSSSCHSLSINYDKKQIFDTLKVDSNGVVKIDCGNYNFCRQRPKRTNSAIEKIVFFVTLFDSWKYSSITDSNKKIEEVKKLILKNTLAKKVKFVNVGDSYIEFSEDFKIPTGKDLYKFLFDKNSWLFLCGDEYGFRNEEDEKTFYNPEEIVE